MPQNRFSGNRGEWSEPYVFLKLLADGQLRQADDNMRPSRVNSAKILGVVREDTRAALSEDGSATFRFAGADGQPRTASLSREDLERGARNLYRAIVSTPQSRGSFALAAPDIPVLEQLGFARLKNPVPAGQRNVKRDISLEIRDPHTGITPRLGFSVKSGLGSPPTLLNASGATNVVYRILGFSDDGMEAVNGIQTGNKLFARAEAIKRLSDGVCFHSYPSEVFRENLSVIDGDLPEIVATALQLHYFENCNTTREMLDRIGRLPRYEKTRADFCAIKYKRFLRACALGMMPSTPWTDVDDAAGGYVIVLPDGELMAFYVYDRSRFGTYLADNTRFDRPSCSRHGYMRVYKEAGQYFVKLNLQIRFLG